MQQAIAHISLVVREYDEAIDFYVDVLGFRLLEDSPRPEQNKRWVVIAPPGDAAVRSRWRAPRRRSSVN